MHQFDPCFYVTASFWPLFQYAQKCDCGGLCPPKWTGGAPKRRQPFFLHFFHTPEFACFLNALCIISKPCKSKTLSFHRLLLLFRALSAHAGAETAQISSNTPSVVSLLYPPCKSAETIFMTQVTFMTLIINNWSLDGSPRWAVWIFREKPTKWCDSA